jgi:hypothetical protein
VPARELPLAGPGTTRRWLGVGNILARKTQGSRHPDQFVDEFLHSSGIARISNPARRRIEQRASVAEVDVREDRHQPQLAQNGEQILNHARAAEWPGRDAANARCLVNVLLQVGIEHVLEQARKAVVVLGHDEDQPIGPFDRGGKLCVLYRLARVVDRQSNFPDVD